MIECYCSRALRTPRSFLMAAIRRTGFVAAIKYVPYLYYATAAATMGIIWQVLSVDRSGAPISAACVLCGIRVRYLLCVTKGWDVLWFYGVGDIALLC